MKIIKRNGTEAVFDVEKIETAITKANERKNYFKQTVADLKELPDIHFFETYVHVDSAVEWAQDSSMPVIAYKKSSRSAKEYQKLTKEILNDAGR